MNRIYLDIDQVLADWSGGLYRLLKVDPAAVLARLPPGEWDVCGSVPGYTKNGVWRCIDEAGADFWANLDLLPWAMDLYESCCRVAPTYLLTSPSMHPSSYAGKAEWVRRHFGARFRNVILTAAKSECAAPGKFLIDDRPSNVANFIKAFGDGVIFPAHGNANVQHLADPLTFIRRELWSRLH